MTRSDACPRDDGRGAGVARRRPGVVAALAAAWLAASAVAMAQPGTPSAAGGSERTPLLRIAFDPSGRDGDGVQLVTRVCRPPGNARAPLVVINHGSPPDPAARARWDTPTCGPVADWFTQRGYVVARPLRRGYGATGGAWAEGYGRCAAADFLAGGLASAADIVAVVRHMRTLPYVASDRLLMVGVSAGGWASLAYASRHPEGLVAVINFAGGRGGHRDNVPNRNCSPDRLVADAGRLGAAVRVPSLWVYAANDSFFDPALAARMHAAFVGAGGRAQLVQPPAFGRDGHALFGTAGLPVWGPIAAAFLDGLH